MRVRSTASFVLPRDRTGRCERCGAAARVLVVLLEPRPAIAPGSPEAGTYVYPERAIGDALSCAVPDCRRAIVRRLLDREEEPPCSPS